MLQLIDLPECRFGCCGSGLESAMNKVPPPTPTPLMQPTKGQRGSEGKGKKGSCDVAEKLSAPD